MRLRLFGFMPALKSGLSDDLFPVQYRLFQGIAVVHQLERKIRPIPVEQAEENFVALPDGQFRHLFLGHPFTRKKKLFQQAIF